MNILYISQYFPPEIGATQVRAKENVLHLRELGHSVTVLTEMPNHPQGIIHSRYRGKLMVREKWQGIPVLRVWVFTRPEKNFFTRILLYLSFMLMGMAAGSLFLRQRFQVVYATSPPIFVGLVGWYLSRLLGGKFVFEVRDLWPKSAVDLGELTNKTVIKMAERLETFYYRKATLNVAVTRGIFDYISAQIGEERLFFLPNGANTRIFSPDFPVPTRIRERFENKFVVSYTGIIGLIHGVDTVIRAAERLQGIPDILFLIIGDGVKKKELKKLVEKFHLQNVIFMDAMQEENLVPYILISQAALATARKMTLTRGTLPVKMFSAMACAVPVILSVVGEGEKLLRAAKAGIVVEPDNAEAMAQAILQFYKNPEQAKKLGRNGREFVMKHFDRRALTRKLEKKLQEVH